jgi:hypothetical protein
MPAVVQAADVTTETLLDDMGSFDRLTRMPDPVYRTYQFSSYDRQSNLPEGRNWFGNSDGFGREKIPAVIRTLKKPDKKGVGTYVIAEMNGPGAIVRCWTAAGGRKGGGINGEIRLYLDDAKEPIYSGKAHEFFCDLYPALARRHKLKPDGLADGFCQRDASYCPIAFAKSCRVEWTGQVNRVHFYHIEMREYAKETTVETFQVKMLDSLREKFKKIGAVLADPSKHLKPTGQVTRMSTTIEPGESNDLIVEREDSGKITWFEMKLDAKNLNRALRQTVLRVYFDRYSRPQIESPLGDFFGAAPGINPYDSLPMEVRPDGTMICRFAMPFARSARCLVTNTSDEPVKIRLKMAVAPYEWDKKRDMHFFARWRVNHDMQIEGRKAFDIPFLCAHGAGRFVGVSVHLLNPSSVPGVKWWGEGDEKIFVDDDTNTPSFFGTGSEDYFNYSWSQPYLFEHAYFAQPRCDGPATRGFVVNNRWHILDDIPFYQRINFYLEMLHHVTVDGFSYARISYYYGRPGIISDHMQPFREDLREPKGPVAWKPVPSNREKNAILYQAEAMGGAAGHIEADPQWAYGKRVLFKPTKGGEQLVLDFNVAKAGKYQVMVVMGMTPTAGMCDIAVNGDPVRGLWNGTGQLDLYTPFHTISRFFRSAPIELKKGKNTITLVSRGKNKESKGTDLGLDFIWIQPR